MTTQAEREAFEAWWNDCDIPWAEEPEHFAWAAWQAARSALARGSASEVPTERQGREVGEPVAWVHKDGRALLRDESMHRATNPADWYPLYTAAPKQQAVEVTEAMVNAAHNAHHLALVNGHKSVRDGIRAALLAALTGKTEAEL